MNWINDVNWSTVGSLMQGVGTIAGAAAVIIAANLGSNTFNSWRQQKLSERRIEQAERILTATYKARRELSYVRSPLMLGHEILAARDKLKETGSWPTYESEQGRFETTQAYYNRLNSAIDSRQGLDECRAIARALFGEELEAAIDTLNRQFHIVRVSVDLKARDRGDSDSKFRNKIDSDLWEGYPCREKNEMDRIIAEQVVTIERICIPILRLEGEGEIRQH
ncbi:hypothetical protein [Phaeospirillum tilakii]|uniref:Uncharacterized protein n=1 Tax=Phaeospirillum tilakii TaxID=741673 RepID=A0ABW5C927_9PROT